MIPHHPFPRLRADLVSGAASPIQPFQAGLSAPAALPPLRRPYSPVVARTCPTGYHGRRGYNLGPTDYSGCVAWG